MTAWRGQMKIDQIFAVENFSNQKRIDWLKQETSHYLKKMEARQCDVLGERAEPVLSPAHLEHFFRHKERCEKLCQILQYLLSFITHIPENDEIGSEPVNPAEQFREFVRYQTDLLMEEDVKNAVFQETNHKEQLSGGNVWDYQERIIAMSNELQKQVAEGETVQRQLFPACAGYWNSYAGSGSKSGVTTSAAPGAAIFFCMSWRGSCKTAAGKLKNHKNHFKIDTQFASSMIKEKYPHRDVFCRQMSFLKSVAQPAILAVAY